jgi:hypothetical protein
MIAIFGMIPFLGAVGATVLTLFAFILAVITFLLIIAAAWICARPIYAFLLFGVIILVSFLGNTTREHFSQQNQNNGTTSQRGFLSY